MKVRIHRERIVDPNLDGSDGMVIKMATELWSEGCRVAIGAWADGGFHTLIGRTDEYAAALMCTDTRELADDDVRLPASAISFHVPNGLTDPLTRVHLFTKEASTSGVVRLFAYTPTTASHGAYNIQITGETLTSVLFDDPDEEHTDGLIDSLWDDDQCALTEIDEEDRRRVKMLRRYVAGLLIAYGDPSNFLSPEKTSRYKKLRALPPKHRIAVLGKPVRNGHRFVESVRNTISKKRKGPLSAQWIVRGHYRRQVHGPSRSLRKVIWIQPYWKGPEEAVILARPHAVGPH